MIGPVKTCQFSVVTESSIMRRLQLPFDVIGDVPIQHVQSEVPHLRMVANRWTSHFWVDLTFTAAIGRQICWRMSCRCYILVDKDSLSCQGWKYPCIVHLPWSRLHQSGICVSPGFYCLTSWWLPEYLNSLSPLIGSKHALILYVFKL